MMSAASGSLLSTCLRTAPGLSWRPPSGEGAGVRDGSPASGALLASCSFSRPSGRSQAVRMAISVARRPNEAGEKWGRGTRRPAFCGACGPSVQILH